MAGELFKRCVNGVVLMLATFAFFCCPVGKKTPAQHVVAILSTRPARAAGAAFAQTATRLFERVRAELYEEGTGPDGHRQAPGESSR